MGTIAKCMRFLLPGVLLLFPVIGITSPDEDISKAVLEGNSGKVAEDLSSGTSPNSRDTSGTPILVLSATLNRPQITKQLLRQGAEPNATNAAGMTALMVAASKKYRSILKTLTQSGADVNFQNPESCASALFYSVLGNDYRGAKHLLEHGALPQLLNNDCDTPRDIAKRRGYTKLVQLLDQIDPPPQITTAAFKVDTAQTKALYAEAKALFSGDNPIQTGVREGAIAEFNIAVLHGKALDPMGQPLDGVTINIAGQPEFGEVRTTHEGEFSMAVAASGREFMLHYNKSGYLGAQRRLPVIPGNYNSVNDVVLFAEADSQGVNGRALRTLMQAAQGEVVTDERGTRQATVIFPPGTTATMELPDCTTRTLSDFHVSILEYTVGDPGSEAPQMPFPLPEESGYTYAVELALDEARRANARRVDFSNPLSVYVDNFLDFPVGYKIPSGSYDKTQEAWVPSNDGGVIKLLGIENGKAVLDLTGQGRAASRSELADAGITDDELRQLAELYRDKIGESFWRVVVTHFSPWDFNHPVGNPDAEPPPPVPPKTEEKKEEDSSDECEQDGCIIKAQSQVLGETIPLTGMPFTLNYRSHRTQGRKAAYRLHVPLRRDNLPESLKRIEVEINIAGRTFKKIFAKEDAPETYLFEWDGKDVFGKPVHGTRVAKTRIKYLYDGFYQIPAEVGKSFGLPGEERGQNFMVKARQEVVMEGPQYQTLLGTWRPENAGLGGFTLSAHHGYDPMSQTLYLGNGSHRKVPKLIPAQKEDDDDDDDDRDRHIELTDDDVRIRHCQDCGKLLVGAARIEPDSIEWRSRRRVQHVSANSGGAFGLTGVDSFDPMSMQSPPSNRWILYGESNANLMSPSGRGAKLGFFYAPGKAEEIRGGEGFYAMLETRGEEMAQGYRTFELSGEGIADSEVNPALTLEVRTDSRSAQTPPEGFAQCIAARANSSTVFTVTPRVDSRLLPPEAGRVEHVMVDLFVREQNISECGSFKEESLTRNRFSLSDYYHFISPSASYGENKSCERQYSILVSAGKSFQIKATNLKGTEEGQVEYRFAIRGHYDYKNPAKWQGSHHAFHLVNPSPVPKRTQTGGDNMSAQDLMNNPAFREALMGGQISQDKIDAMIQASRNAGGYGGLQPNRCATHCPVGGGPKGDSFSILIASQDGGLLYKFEDGRHVETLDSITGNALYTFTYDEAGYLSEIRDIDGDTTKIERDRDHRPVAIVAPYGQRTRLETNRDGYLAAVTNPARETYRLRYTPDGLLTEFTDPANNTYTYRYDEQGLFIEDEDPVGGGWRVAREDISDGHVITMTSREGREYVYKTRDENGTTVRENIAPDDTAIRSITEKPYNNRETAAEQEDEARWQGYMSGQIQGISENQRETRRITYPDGTELNIEQGGDPRFGMQSPLAKQVTFTTPGGLKAVMATRRKVEPESAVHQPLEVEKVIYEVAINGKSRTSEYDKKDNRITATSAAGRKSVSYLDANGRLIKEETSGLAAIEYKYDRKGRLTKVTQGKGRDARTAEVEYDKQGYLRKLTDPLGRSASFEYDDAGRVTVQVSSGNQTIRYRYDANSNLTALSPPGRPAHEFNYTPVNLQSEYIPPDASIRQPETRYEYNLDQQLTRITRPDGKAIDIHYHPQSGKLQSAQVPGGEYRYEYNDQDGQLQSLSGPNGSRLSYRYDGALPISVQWENSPVTGELELQYDNDLRIQSTRVDDQAVDYRYDDDNLLTQAGDLRLDYHRDNGLLTGTDLGAIKTERTYNEFGEIASETTAHNGRVLYKVAFRYDKLGRIVQKTETIQGQKQTYDYRYDNAGRLEQVRLNGRDSERYRYDENGNRLSAETEQGRAQGRYDEQDRLLEYGDNRYTYTDNGELQRKDGRDGATEYDYDVIGNLRSVKLPNQTIEYVIDAADRRVGKKVDGRLEKGWLYLDELNPIAELDGQGKVSSLFVYASRANVPEYMVKDGRTYRLVTDQVGSVRLVVDVNSGEVAQRIEYDSFGRVLEDTHPGFQPFGFAGGLYDADTGLVRFGARDYDAETGRWTAKDPILFDGNDSNLYGYVVNDPSNLIDPEGTFWNLAIGALSGAATGYLIAKLTGDCYTWKDALADAALGAVGAGLASKLNKLYRISKARNLAKGLNMKPGNSTPQIERWVGDGSKKLEIKYKAGKAKGSGFPRLAFKVEKGKWWDPFKNTFGSRKSAASHVPLEPVDAKLAGGAGGLGGLLTPTNSPDCGCL